MLELACGAGHFLRTFTGHAAEVVGGDLVFAKLWLARHWIAPQATLVCFDAAAPWPFASGAADLLFCHDAFYFLPNKPAVAAEMQRAGARILIGHMHNALVDNLSAGEPLDPAGYAALFATPDLFDDRELTAALIAARVPRAATARDLAAAPAVALGRPRGRTGRGGRTSHHAAGGRGAAAQPALRRWRNPLAVGALRDRVWSAGDIPRPGPTPRTGPSPGSNAAIDALARRRTLIDLPERW